MATRRAYAAAGSSPASAEALEGAASSQPAELDPRPACVVTAALGVPPKQSVELVTRSLDSTADLNTLSGRVQAGMAHGQSAARKDIVGTVGYCMSGRYAINAAMHFPERVRAAASIYGTHLATEEPDSPHLAVQKTRAELYFACAETDIYAPPEIIEKLKHGMKDHRANAEVEIYPGTHHGFAFPKRPVYHRDAAERHWERLLALYRRNLSS